MTKTDRKAYLYCPRMGWHRGFNRRVYVGVDGAEYVYMRGWTKLDWATEHADWYSIERD